MTERIQNLLERTFEKEQRAFRRDVDWKPLLARFIADGTRDEARARIGLEEMLKAETPAFMDGERLAFLRTVRTIPDLHSDAEMDARRASGTAFGEKGVVFNLTADFAPTIRDGLDARLAEIASRLDAAKAANDAAGVEFLENAALSVKAVLDLAAHHRAPAVRRSGESRLSDAPRAHRRCRSAAPAHPPARAARRARIHAALIADICLLHF